MNLDSDVPVVHRLISKTAISPGQGQIDLLPDWDVFPAISSIPILTYKGQFFSWTRTWNNFHFITK